MKAIVICGPTGSGKSRAAMTIARRYNCSIVGADSRQVYRRLDIGTAKPSLEQRREIPHYLIDIADISEDFTAMRYVREALSSLELAAGVNRIPIVAGGTGLYIEALTKGIFVGPGKDESIREELEERARREGLAVLYRELDSADPVTAAAISPNDRIRLIRALEILRKTGMPPSAARQSDEYIRSDADFLWIGLEVPRNLLYERINDRVDRMIDDGLIDEIKGLLRDGLGSYIKEKKIVGYREIIAAVENQSDLNEAVALMKRRTRNYAKRQLTWFRNRTNAIWLDPTGRDFERKVFSLLDEHLNRT